MKRKITVSFLIMALVCCLIGGATFAFFTDSATNAGNTFSTGTVDLEFGSATTMPFTVTDMAPGDSVNKSIVLENNGSLGLYWNAQLQNITDDALVLPAIGTLADKLLVTIAVGGVNICEDQTLSSLDGSPYVCPNELLTGATTTYQITVKLPADVGNEAQGLKYEANLVFNAVQSANQADPANPVF